MNKRILSLTAAVFMSLTLISCAKTPDNNGGNDITDGITVTDGLYSEETGNSVNGGYAVEYGGGYLFGGTKDNEELVFFGADGKKKIDDGFFREMAVYGNDLYYVNGRPGYVGKLSLDSLEKESVAHKSSGNLTLYADRLYYRVSSLSNFGEVYCVDLSSDEKMSVAVADKVMNFCISGNRIYYCNMADGNTLWSMNLDGSDRKKISDIYAVSLVCDAEFLYCSDFNSGTLKSYRISDGEEKVLTDDNCRGLTLRGGKLFYVNRSDGRSLWSMNTDGTGALKLADGIVDEVVALDGKVFFEREKETVINEDADDEGELVSESLGYFVIDLDTMTETPVS